MDCFLQSRTETLPLKDYQVKTVQFGMQNPYCIFALKMGLGKTVTSIAVAVNLNLKALVIVPGYLRENFKADIEKFYPSKKFKIIKDSKTLSKFTPTDEDFIISSYGIIAHCEKLFEWCGICIADEATYLKEMTSQRTEHFHKHVYENNLKRLILLTGTPIQNRVYEFYSLIVLCCYNPEVDEVRKNFLTKFPSYIEFADYFSFRRVKSIAFKKYGKILTKKVLSWDGIRRLDELRGYLKGIYIRFDDTVLDLPDMIEMPVRVLAEDYPEMLEQFENFKGVSPEVKSKAALATVDATFEYTKNLIDQGETHIIIYSDHVKSTEYLAEKFKTKPIHGGVDMSERVKISYAWKRDGGVLCATYGSFSTGVNLTESNHIVANDPPWVPGVLDQAKYRIKRIGQNKTCYFHKILGSKQSESIYKSLEAKLSVINQVMN